MNAFQFDDARMPTDTEQAGLCQLVYLAFVDIRALILDGKSQQAKDLAEAFHNIPLFMNTANFSFKAFQDSIQRYQAKYKDGTRYNYLQEWGKLNAAKQ
ncbi:MAG TPA: hypothetical protein VF988_13290 [Verrucomicrobiae bacterium]